MLRSYSMLVLRKRVVHVYAVPTAIPFELSSCVEHPTRKTPRIVPQAKYGDESVYFDLNDVENTAGAWDMYGVDSSKRYPDQQAEFFERAANGLARREAMLGFLAI
eukprot:7433181-Pyramimonas_sp.AAC.1